MNPNYQFYYVSTNYLSQIYENSAYYYQNGSDPRAQISDLAPQQLVSALFQDVKIQQDNACKEEYTTKINQQTTKMKKKRNKESQISQNSLNESSEQQINLVSRQKYGRNIISNIVHHMIKRFLTDQFDDMIQKIIQRYHLNTSLFEFKELLSKRDSKLGIYLKFSKIKALLEGHSYRNRIKQQTLQKQIIFNKIFRILYIYYLKNVHILHLYNTLKLKEKSKKYHIQGVTKLLQLLKQ